jgi:hypothetical protein
MSVPTMVVSPASCLLQNTEMPGAQKVSYLRWSSLFPTHSLLKNLITGGHRSAHHIPFHKPSNELPSFFVLLAGSTDEKLDPVYGHRKA